MEKTVVEYYVYDYGRKGESGRTVLECRKLTPSGYLDTRSVRLPDRVHPFWSRKSCVVRRGGLAEQL